MDHKSGIRHHDRSVCTHGPVLFHLGGEPQLHQGFDAMGGGAGALQHDFMALLGTEVGLRDGTQVAVTA